MASKSFLRGHPIIYINEEWVYTDTKEPTAGNPRSCGKCGEEDTPEGHDACLGIIPGVKNACCGHGENGEAYIDYWDGKRFVLEATDVMELQERLNKALEKLEAK